VGRGQRKAGKLGQLAAAQGWLDKGRALPKGWPAIQQRAAWLILAARELYAGAAEYGAVDYEPDSTVMLGPGSSLPQ
jgi:hypothetical protein